MDRSRGSAEILESDITNLVEIPHKDSQNRLFYGYYDKIPVFIKSLRNDQTERKAITREYKIHSKLSNPQIIEFIGYYFKGNTINIVTKRAECSLSEFLRKNPKLTMFQKRYILYSVAYGLTYLKWNNVMHHDLKVTLD